MSPEWGRSKVKIKSYKLYKPTQCSEPVQDIFVSTALHSQLEYPLHEPTLLLASLRRQKISMSNNWSILVGCAQYVCPSLLALDTNDVNVLSYLRPCPAYFRVIDTPITACILSDDREQQMSVNR